jgi:hypothetical protein
MSRVDWKSSPHALKPNQPVDHLYWPNFIVEEPNGTFFTGPYAHRPCIVFWAPAIFWPRYGKRPRVDVNEPDESSPQLYSDPGRSYAS